MLPTTSLTAVFFFSFVAALGAVISPGPVSTTIVSQAPRRGWSVGPFVSTGHALMELALVALIALGLGAGLARTGIQTTISLLGALLLAWMGGTMILDVLRGKIYLPRRDDRQNELSSRQMVGLGIAATASNPFWYTWWVTVAASYLSQAMDLGLGAVLAFYLGHISVDYAWNTLLSTAISSGKRWMNDQVYRALMIACAVFFLYLSWVFLTRGIRAL